MRALVLITFGAWLAGCSAGTAPGIVDAPFDTPSDAPSDAPSAGDLGTENDASMPCGSSTCGPGEICVSGRCAGCCDLPPSCIPIPTGCAGTLGCGCFASDPCGGCTTCGSVDGTGIHCVNCMCTCAAAWTPIDTPDGPRAIDTLRVGDRVFTLDHGRVVVAPIVRVRRQSVTHHVLVRVTLTSGGLVEMSGSHPTADGRRFDALVVGDRLGDAVIAALETIPYDEDATFDVLPSSDSGAYRVNGAWVGSTLHARAPCAK